MTNVNTIRRVLALAASVVAVVLGMSFLIGYSPPAKATPDVTWSQPSVSATFQPGQPVTTVVTLTAGDELAPAAVRITPSLVPYVSVSPMTTGLLRRGQTQQFTVTFSAPIDALPTATQGTIQLRTGKVIAKPLPVAISVVWPQATNLPSGVTFAYSTFGQPSHLDVEQYPDGVILTGVVFTASGRDPIDQYAVNFVPNPQRLSVTDWFSRYVDLSGAIISGGNYRLDQLPNGMQALAIQGELPPAHFEVSGPVGSLYASSRDNSTIVVIQTGQDHDFGLLGITPEKRFAVYREILQSMTFR